MAESIALKKRLIGKEDVDFDISGNGETEYFQTPSGESKKISKINASHIPLTKQTKKSIGEDNVDAALLMLKEEIDGFETFDALTQDVVVNFLSTDDNDAVLSKIKQQKTNLNQFAFHKLLD